MALRAGVFCHNGLGDGINCLTLSNNLHLNGWKVDTYQNTIWSMQNWFPHLSVQPYPSLEELPRILETYDWFFVVQNDSDPFVTALIQEGKRRFPERLKVIYLYSSKNIVNEPYYTDCLVDPRLSVAENLRQLCDKVLHLPKTTKSNGFIPLPGLISRKFLQRVVVHPTASRPTRSWSKEKFIKLASHLQNEGYQPVFIPGPKDSAEWKSAGIEVQEFASLDPLARYLYESGYLIGNDSGPGHLASALGVPTLTLSRRKTLANLWAPSFQRGVVVTPYSWIPNIRGLRLRDKYWKQCISVGMVERAFKQLVRGGKAM